MIEALTAAVQPALAAPADLGVERVAQHRPVLPQQPRVHEPRHVVAAALGEHDPVQAAPVPVIGHVKLAQARRAQVPGQHDHPLLGPVQVVQALGQPPRYGAALPAAEQIRQGHAPNYHRQPRCGGRSRAGRGAGGSRFGDYTLPMPGTEAPRWRFLITPKWLAWHVVMVGSVYGMLALGNWQLHRAESGNGLSWAYTFEWPIFAVFAVVFWAKTIRDEFHPPAATGPAGEDVALPAGV